MLTYGLYELNWANENESYKVLMRCTVINCILIIITIITIIIIILHFNICKEIGVQLDKKHWYEHVPKSVETSQGGKVTLWNQQVQTDRTIPNKKNRHNP